MARQILDNCEDSNEYRDIVNENFEEVYTGLDGANTSISAINTTISNLAQNNFIINGNFDVWQRGTTISLSASAIPYLADRWYDYITNDGGVLPVMSRSRQETTTLPYSAYYSRFTTDGAGSGFGGNAGHRYVQKIENGTKLFCGDNKKITLSFFARSTIPNKKLGIVGFQNYGTGGTPSTQDMFSTPDPRIITLTTDWIKYTTTFTTTTLSGKTFGSDNNNYVYIGLINMWGSTWSTTYLDGSTETYRGAGIIDITQVKLEISDTATPFIPRSYGEELLLCKRYYQILGTFLGFPYNTAILLVRSATFPVEMRITPHTITFSSQPNLTGTYGYLDRYGTGNVDVTGSTVQMYSHSLCTITKTGAFVVSAFYTGSAILEADF